MGAGKAWGAVEGRGCISQGAGAGQSRCGAGQVWGAIEERGHAGTGSQVCVTVHAGIGRQQRLKVHAGIASSNA
eukprot:365240-Chlamydomonas_euryale.AAC.6